MLGESRRRLQPERSTQVTDPPPTRTGQEGRSVDYRQALGPSRRTLGARHRETTLLRICSKPLAAAFRDTDDGLLGQRAEYTCSIALGLVEASAAGEAHVRSVTIT